MLSTDAAFKFGVRECHPLMDGSISSDVLGVKIRSKSVDCKFHPISVASRDFCLADFSSTKTFSWSVFSSFISLFLDFSSKFIDVGGASEFQSISRGVVVVSTLQSVSSCPSGILTNVLNDL